MRTIKFRGKTRLGDWVTGLLSSCVWSSEKNDWVKGTFISSSEGLPWSVAVVPETVGQFTETHDMDGKEIYPDDIVSVDGTDIIRVIQWYAEALCYEANTPGGDICSLTAYNSVNQLRVIGTTFDNPYLLKK